MSLCMPYPIPQNKEESYKSKLTNKALLGMLPCLPPLQVTLVWQFTQHVEGKARKADKEWTNAAIGLLTSGQLLTNSSVSLSAHQASSLDQHTICQWYESFFLFSVRAKFASDDRTRQWVFKKNCSVSKSYQIPVSLE